MRFLITLTLFSITFFAIGQNNSDTYNSTKISDAEKKRLENEFKALGSFYIDDSGVVVYQNASNLTSIQDEDSTTTIKDQIPLITSDTNIQNEEKYTPPVKTKTAPPPPSNSFFYKKDVKINQTTYNTSNTSTSINPIVNERIVEDNKVFEIKEDSPSKKEEIKKKGSILNQRKTSQYKSMEEAALAVEALLEELKKEENKGSSTGNSMSSRLSRGVNKDLRKTTNYRSANSIQNQYQTDNTVENSSFGVEPSYFINGKQVEKVEISKLRKSDIIRREVRVRNTVTGNPNGEVWYEVK